MRWRGRARKRDAPAERARIGIVSPYMFRKGLTTLTRNIEWALEGRAEVFAVRKLARLDSEFERARARRVDPALRHPRVVASGTRLLEWLRGLDLLIAVERPAPRLCAHCRELGVRSVVVALPDWLPEAAAERVAGLSAADACVVYSPAAARALEEEGLSNVVSLPLALDSPVEAPRAPGEDLVFYFNVGVAGALDRRNVPLVLETFRRLLPRRDRVRLVVKLHPRALRKLGAVDAVHPRMSVVATEAPPAEMRELQRAADVSLFPSRYEGVGYPLLESLHASVPVIATDAPPMNELIRDGENGLRVRARPAGRFGAQTYWDLDPDHFREQVERCASDPDLVARLKTGAGKGRAEAAAAFRDGWRSLARRLGRRRLNLGAGDDRREDAINLDIRPLAGVDVVAAAQALPFADGSLDELLAQDLLEHFPGEETGRVLDEWVRVLRPGGRMRVQTPDLRALARVLARGRLSTEKAVEWLYGAQDHGFNFHYTGFDEARLRRLLAERAIEDIERVRERVSSKNVCLVGRRAER